MSGIPDLAWPEVDAPLLMDYFKDYRFPRKAIADYVRKGIFTRIKPGIYIQNVGASHPWSREILANMIYGPSYISFEYALSYWGLIPERVVEVTSATCGKTRRFHTPVGRFSYRHLNSEYYAVGYTFIELEQGRGFLIASPEKALCDRISIAKGRFSLQSMEQFLLESLRIDIDELHKLDKDTLSQICKSGTRSSVQVFYKYITGSIL